MKLKPANKSPIVASVGSTTFDSFVWIPIREDSKLAKLGSVTSRIVNTTSPMVVRSLRSQIIKFLFLGGVRSFEVGLWSGQHSFFCWKGVQIQIVSGEQVPGQFQQVAIFTVEQFCHSDVVPKIFSPFTKRILSSQNHKIVSIEMSSFWKHEELIFEQRLKVNRIGTGPFVDQRVTDRLQLLNFTAGIGYAFENIEAKNRSLGIFRNLLQCFCDKWTAPRNLDS